MLDFSVPIDPPVHGTLPSLTLTLTRPNPNETDVGYRAFCHGYGRSTGDVDPTALMMDDEREPPKQSIEFVVVT